MNKRYIDFARDPTSSLDAFWYRVVWLLGSAQEFILRRCVKQIVWRSFNGEVFTPKTMTDAHLRNAIKFCQRNDDILSPQYAALLAERDMRQRLWSRGLQ